MQDTVERLPVWTNQPSRGWALPDLRELWQYRELLSSFVSRDLKVRYKQTALGAAWAVLQPFLTMLVFSAFFGRLVPAPGGVPYPVFIYVALVPWTYFSNTLTRIGNGLVEQQELITKVYFPRLLIPVSALVVGVVDFAIATLVLIGIMIFYGLTPSLALWTAPLFLLLAMATVLGTGLWLAALNVEYRDIQQILPFLIQTWLFATPVFYSADLVRSSWRLFYALNPMVGVIEGFRWALLGREPAPGPIVFVSLVTVVVVLAGGLMYFRHAEDSFADVV